MDKRISLAKNMGKSLTNKYGLKIADKIKSVSKKKSTKELHNNDQTKEEDAEITCHKKRYISPEERQQVIEELRLVPIKDAHF